MKKPQPMRVIRYECRVCSAHISTDQKPLNPQFPAEETIRIIRCEECTIADAKRSQSQRGSFIIQKKPDAKNRVFGKVEVGNAE